MIEEGEETQCHDGKVCGGKNTTRQKLEPGQRYVCVQCQAAKYIVPVMNEINKKMKHVMKAPGDANRFPIRELVQNADDAYANTIVIRMEEDAVYFANDGYRFRSREGGFDGDWVRLLCGISKSKEREVESIGTHGSGFQTVYHFTNHPEIFSSGESIKLDPTNPSEDGRIIHLDSRNEQKKRSPYHPEGALFRFPWRTDKEASRMYSKDVPFKSFKTWDEDSIASLTEDLRAYLHDLILCCQRVRVARVIWGDPPVAYEVRRNGFKLDELVQKEHFYKATVEEGMVDVPDDWEAGFRSGEPQWSKTASPPERLDYLIGSSFVTDKDGRRVYYGESESGKEVVTSDERGVQGDKEGPIGKRLLHKGNIHVLIPLFNVRGEGRTERPDYYRYSVLPIPSQSQNMFACTAHVMVEENRGSLILSPVETNGRWFSLIMTSLGRLYLTTFKEYLRGIQSGTNSSLSNETLQGIVLNAVPGTPLPTWISPEEIQDQELFQHDEDLSESLANLPILLSGRSWVAPIHAYWVEDHETASLIQRLGAPVFEQAFVQHKKFRRLGSKLEGNRFESDDFLSAWNEFSKSNPGALRFEQKLSDSTALDQDTIEHLIRYCLESTIPEIRGLPVIPDRKGVLRSIDDYPVVPQGYEALNNLLRDEKKVNDSFVNLVRLLDRRIAFANDIIRTLSEEIENQKMRFNEVNDGDLLLLAQVMSKAVTNQKFALQDVANCWFIPYEYQGRVRVGQPNKINGSLFTETEHAGENYHKNFIFKEQRKEIPGLTAEIRRGIRILSLPGIEEQTVALVETRLYLVALLERKAPTNFIRVFISPDSEHGSLFEDQVLSNFLVRESVISTKIDREILVRQKLALLKVAQSYFVSPTKGSESGIDKESMGRVPMLYDTGGIWRAASDFAYDIDDTLRMFGKFALHPDFKDENEWPKRALVDRLGVCETMTVDQVATAIVKLTADHDNENRSKLSRICSYLLTSNIELANDKGVQLSNLQEFENLEWIPTLNGKLTVANSCLLPTKRNKAALGADFDFFVELEKHVFERIDSDQVSDRASAFGIPRIASRDLLLETVQKYYLKNKRPPESLFDELSKDDVTSGYPESTYGRPFGKMVYYSEGKWWKRESIKLMSEQGVPVQLQEKYLIVKEGASQESSRHVRYLMYFLGVDVAFSDEEILELMKQKSLRIDISLWTLLAESKCEAEDSEVEYGNLPIFPRPDNEGQFVRPNHVIFKKGLFTEAGEWGEWYVLDVTNLPHTVIEKLKELGAREGHEVDPGILKSILYGMAWQGRIHDDSRYDKMMKIMQRIAHLSNEGQDLSLDQKCVPIRFANGEIECKKLTECYKNDHFKARMFMGRLPIPEAMVGDEYDRSLETYFLKKCGKSFKEEMTANPTLVADKPENDKNQEKRFHELGRALSVYFKRLESVTLEDSIRWLERCQVNRYDEVRVDYRVGGIDGATSGYYVDAGDDAVKINLARVATERIRNELPLELFITCQAKRQSKELADRKDQILGILTQLLFSDDLRTWSFVVPNYNYKGDNPIVEPLVDILETTDGYRETKAQLKRWYGACQICFGRTPSGEKGDESCETVTSIVSLRGGRYAKTIDSYSPGQCLFLCPTHQTLYKRGLIRVPYLEPILRQEFQKTKELLSKTRADTGKYPKKDDIILQYWEIYETPVDDGFLSSMKDWRWKSKEIRFRRDHLLQMVDYIEGRIGEWQDE